MKYLLFITLFLAALLPNCKKEQMIIKTPAPVDTIAPIDTVSHIIAFGQSSIVKNGVAWNASYKAFYNYFTKTNFSITAQKSYPNGLSENSFIQDIPLAIGKYSITMLTSFNDVNNGIPDAGYTMANYDEGIGNFFPDTTRTDNFIEVLRFDTISREVEGRFQVFMGKDGGPSTLPGVPDSVFLTEGKFYLKLQ